MNITQCDDFLWLLNEETGVCVHKDLLPYHWADLFLSFSLVLFSIFSTIVGVGGGGVLLPLFLLAGNFGIYYAIPLTVITIAGNSLARVLVLFNKKHPKYVNRYLINYSNISLIVPFDGATAFIGFILNTVSPPWLILVNIILILGYIIYKILKKGFQQTVINTDGDYIYIDGISYPISRQTVEVDNIEIEPESDIGDNSKKRIIYWIYLIFIFFFILAFSLIRNLFKKCSPFYWSFYSIQLIILIAIGFLCGYYHISHQKNNQEQIYDGKQNNQDVEDIINWTKKQVSLFAFCSSLTGVISTYIGIGGGMLINPFLLYMGFSPEVSSATVSVTTFFSSLFSTFQYIGTDRILVYYSIYFFSLAFISSLIGIKISNVIIKKFKQRWMIFILLAFFIAISIVSLVMVGLINLDTSEIGFKEFC